MEPDTFENKLNRLAGRLSNVVLLGFFCLLCCIPVVTIGASFSALYTAMADYLDNGNDKVLRPFFKAFRQQFALSTKVFALHLIFIPIFVWDLLYYRTGTSTLDYIGQAASFSLLMLLVFELTVVWIVISHGMEEKTFKVISTALDLAFSCFPESLSLLGLTAAAFVVSVVILRPFILVLPGVICYLHYQIIPRMLEKYRFKKNHADYVKGNK